MAPVIIISALISVVFLVYIGVWIKFETENFKDGTVDTKESKALYIIRVVTQGLFMLSYLFRCLINMFKIMGFGFAERISDIEFFWYLPLILFLICAVTCALEYEINTKDK
ncbi:MAG: hypothetical protein IJL71_02515 [Oscillospiraceae bacterium]|nr:hypothetical protein [Oscillospiraceae bacterium]